MLQAHGRIFLHGRAKCGKTRFGKALIKLCEEHGVQARLIDEGQKIGQEKARLTIITKTLNRSSVAAV